MRIDTGVPVFMRTQSFYPLSSFSLFTPALIGLLAAWPASAFPPGPTPQVPDGGGPPRPFPNPSVTAVNVLARGSSTGFNSSVEVTGFEGQGPIPWTINRYNRGD